MTTARAVQRVGALTFENRAVRSRYVPAVKAIVFSSWRAQSVVRRSRPAW